ncbi:MAG: ribonuclease G, partial [Elusimicrobia bacterium]|nr:ribonuclease G [Elusimicrobiota bacterium]
MNEKTVPQEKNKFKKDIFANTSFEETRIAIMEDDNLAELFWERRGTANVVGNIYKGTVENVLPGISSAFINIGLDKNAYIYISDVLGNHRDGIARLLKRNQHVMIQVAKDAISTKGMKVTMDISLPGRFLVLTPF